VKRNRCSLSCALECNVHAVWELTSCVQYLSFWLLFPFKVHYIICSVFWTKQYFASWRWIDKRLTASANKDLLMDWSFCYTTSFKEGRKITTVALLRTITYEDHRREMRWLNWQVHFTDKLRQIRIKLHKYSAIPWWQYISSLPGLWVLSPGKNSAHLCTSENVQYSVRYKVMTPNR